ncbi:hypothetical protein [Roseisolibacter sp. H3M3-2]|uniref:hypothetical protein n=1 Tax=Roseisolibacter sp. H3M3-2 TaxID=3031323 RepID=UPI0023DBD61A|nr:hypothetical protein [Roseisolibacter sp. H3M3-2]MDF1505381.1 hypothetical protein [Roseisolibacter sp. H3M3-2]
MAELDRPERITNITGLRAQPETPERGATSVGRPVRWPSAPCRLCERPVWVFARTCACGMPSPGRQARGPYLAQAAVAVVVVGAAAWWAARR